MNNIENPIQAILDWFVTQPLEIRQDLAFLTLYSLSGINSAVQDPSTNNPEGVMEGWLEQQAKLSSPNQLVGTTICVRAAIDFFVMCNRETKEDWIKTIEFNQTIRNRIGATGKDASFIDKMLERLPFRSKLWIKATKSWRNLCNETLSDDSLRTWMTLQEATTVLE